MKQRSVWKKVTAGFVTTCLLAAMLLTPMTALAANGPSDSGFAYVTLIERGTGKFKDVYRANKESAKVKGISYNQKTNTMTLNGVNAPNTLLEINEMGEDFTIVVKGTNTLNSIMVWGFGYGGGLRITGSGKLTLNQKKERQHAIELRAEYSPAKLTIDSKVKLIAYSPKGEDAFAIDATEHSTKGMRIAGASSIKPTGSTRRVISYNAYTTTETPFKSATPKDSSDKTRYCARETGIYNEAAGEVVWECVIMKIVTDPTYGDFAIDALDKKGNPVDPEQFIISKNTDVKYKGDKMNLTGYTNSASPKTKYGVVRSGNNGEEYYVFKLKESKTLNSLVAVPVKSLQGVTKLPKTYSMETSAKKHYNYSFGGAAYKTPTATALSKVTAKASGFTAAWKKQTSGSGYQLSYATNSKFQNAKTVTVSKNTATSQTVTGLTAKKKYFVRVRTYKTIKGVKVYTPWSSAKTVTTK